MKNFIAITICFIVGLFVCQQANGQDLNQPSSAIHESDQLVVKFSECGQDCNFCDRAPVRNAVKGIARGVSNVGSRAMNFTRNSVCRTRKMIRNTASHARCVTKRMASRARAFTGRVFSRGCCR